MEIVLIRVTCLSYFYWIKNAVQRNKPELWFLVCVLSPRSFIHWQLVVTTPSLSVVIPLAPRHLHAVLLMTGHHLHSLPPLCHKPHFLGETLRKDQEHASTFSQLPSRSKLAGVVPWSRLDLRFSIYLFLFVIVPRERCRSGLGQTEWHYIMTPLTPSPPTVTHSGPHYCPTLPFTAPLATLYDSWTEWRGRKLSSQQKHCPSSPS